MLKEEAKKLIETFTKY